MKLFVAVLLTVVCVTFASSAFATSRDEVVGQYRYMREWRQNDEYYRINFTLYLGKDGKAELIAQSRSDFYNVDGRFIRDNGELVDYLTVKGETSHKGTWELRRHDEVRIDLDRFYDGRRTRNIYSRFVSKFDKGKLRVSEHDKDMYGSKPRFVFENRSWRPPVDPDKPTNKPTPQPEISDDYFNPAYKGTYKTSRSWTDTKGRRIQVSYTLSIQSNGDAVLTTQTSDSFSADGNLVRWQGQILNYLLRSNKVSHSGKCFSKRGDIVLSLNILKGTGISERKISTMYGRVSGSRITIDRMDETLYGRGWHMSLSRR